MFVNRFIALGVTCILFSQAACAAETTESGVTIGTSHDAMLDDSSQAALADFFQFYNLELQTLDVNAVPRVLGATVMAFQDRLPGWDFSPSVSLFRLGQRHHWIQMATDATGQPYTLIASDGVLPMAIARENPVTIAMQNDGRMLKTYYSSDTCDALENRVGAWLSDKRVSTVGVGGVVGAAIFNQIWRRLQGPTRANLARSLDDVTQADPRGELEWFAAAYSADNLRGRLENLTTNRYILSAVAGAFALFLTARLVNAVAADVPPECLQPSRVELLD